MDRMDRMLRALPQEAPPPGMAGRLLSVVHRRHRRRQFARWMSVAGLGIAGLWQILPGLVWLSSNEIYGSGASWLLSGIDYLNYESLDMANRLLTGALSAQYTIGYSVQLSVWVGALLLCGAIFLALGSRGWQASVQPGPEAGKSTLQASSLHI